MKLLIFTQNNKTNLYISTEENIITILFELIQHNISLPGLCNSIDEAIKDHDISYQIIDVEENEEPCVRGAYNIPMQGSLIWKN